jgi:Na+-translocating ferredoxin:NAD+ oxidoreductase RnfC subunit
MTRIRIEDISAAGVVGAGGAGFPTHVKLAASADTVLLNGAECEPLLHKDKEILRRHGAEVLEGVRAAMQLVGATQGLVGVKGKYKDVIDSLRPLAGPGLEVRALSDSYPAGDEMILVYDLLRRVVPPGGIPLHVGAVVINVETALNVARAAERPVTEKFVSVAGAVAEPCTLRVPIGTSLAECLAAAGGAAVPDPVYLTGGVMMGRLAEDLRAPVTKTTAALLVFPEEHVVVRRYRRDHKQHVRIGRSACDQCSFCTELCPRWLLGHPIEPHKAMRSLGFNLVGEANVIGTSFCCECNLCSLYSCPEDLDPKDICAENKHRLAAAGQRWQEPPFNPRRPDLHLDNRRVPMQRLMQRLGLTKFRNVGPLRDEPLRPARVAVPLKQHAGAACQPTVLLGARVRPGDVLAVPPWQDGKPALGANVHASIAGRVSAVEDGAILIEA